VQGCHWLFVPNGRILASGRQGSDYAAEHVPAKPRTHLLSCRLVDKDLASNVLQVETSQPRYFGQINDLLQHFSTDRGPRPDEPVLAGIGVAGFPLPRIVTVVPRRTAKVCVLRPSVIPLKLSPVKPRDSYPVGANGSTHLGPLFLGLLTQRLTG
jgi:hypothetical protein